MIHFLFGEPGSGKTAGIFGYIRVEVPTAVRDGRRLFLIVPEQMMYETESTLLPTLPPEAGRVFSVTSFSRLCTAADDLYGGRTCASLSRASGSLLMWQTLRTLRGSLSSYVMPDGDDTSLCRLMLDTAAELAVNAVDARRLEAAVDSLDKDAPLRLKVEDIVTVTGTYEAAVERLTGGVPFDRMLRAAKKIAAGGFFDGSSVYIDSFTSFTPEEYLMLREILAQASEVIVSIPAAKADASDAPFISIRETVRRLRALCDTVGKPFECDVLSGDRRTASPVLSALRRQLWDFSLTPGGRAFPDVTAEDTDALRLVTAPNVYEEARAAALHVGKLHRSGIPYERIAIVVRDTAEWKGVLDAVLDEYKLPYFLSDRTGLADKPAARLLLLALRCIRRGYLTGDVISLAKTGLCGVSLSDLDAFEEYVETWRISGRRMTGGPWSMNPDGFKIETTPRARSILAAANRARQILIPPLTALESALGSAETPEEQSRALFAYLTTLDVRRRMSDLAAQQLAAGQVREAGETVRLWSFIVRALADLATLLDPAAGRLSNDDLSAALSILFEETDIGSVPGRHDCIIIGSASTVRLGNVDAVLLLGLVDGAFPRSVTDTGLLTEQDKQSLEELGIGLVSRADRQTSEELLYVWRAVSAASRHVLLFTHEGTPDNTSCAPSLAWSRVRWLYPRIEPLAFREKDVLRDGERPAAYRPAVDDRLDPATVRRVLPDPVWLSHSALQNYARCPYSYFGGHILRVREKVEAKIDDMNTGIFLHRIFEEFLRRSLSGSRKIRHMTAEEIADTADAIMDDYIRGLNVDVEGDGRILHLFARLRTLALVLLGSIQAELEQGLFFTERLELGTYGRRPDEASPLELPVEVEVPADDEDDSSTDDENESAAGDEKESEAGDEKESEADNGIESAADNGIESAADNENESAAGDEKESEARYENESAAGHDTESPIGLEAEVPVTDGDLLGAAGLFHLPTPHGLLPGGGEQFALPRMKRQTVHVRMGGRIDRVDVFRDGTTAYVRVIDYKSSTHDFSEKKLARDMDLQMLLYLFTLCADRNRALFADENGVEPSAVLPAEVLYISPETENKTGRQSAHRSGLILDDPDVLHAASTALDLTFLPCVKRDKTTGVLSGDGLCSPTHMEELKELVTSLIVDVTREIFGGRAARRPSANSCRFCSMQDSCPVAVRTAQY